MPGDGIAPERIDHYFVPRVFGEIGAYDMLDDVLALRRGARPGPRPLRDLRASPARSSRPRGVPSSSTCSGPLLAPDVLALADDAMSPLWRIARACGPRLRGALRGHDHRICPPSLESRAVPRGATLRLRPAPLPVMPPVTAGRPLVYVTLGTSFMAATPVFRTILDGLADADVDVVVTVGRDGDPDALERVPANATVERFVPQAGAAAQVRRGRPPRRGRHDFGALAHGLPQVVLPQGADNFSNAAMLESAGAAVVLHPGGVTAATVREAVLEILDRPRYAEAARTLATEMAQMDAPDVVAAALRAVVA